VVDFNQYGGILQGAIAALSGDSSGIEHTVDTFKHRRDAFVGALNRIGWEVTTPDATMYIWAKLPERWANSSLEFCAELVAKTGVAASPGVGFGKCGEGYVRFALVREPAILLEAVDRIATFLWQN
jgi:aspartate/methionine/tyrosine aminotransferase